MAAAVLGTLSVAKMKLLDSALGKFADVAKNSGALNDLFDTMKEGAMITAPWQTFLNILKAETTMASVDSIKGLFALLKEPSTQAAIELLSNTFAGLVKEVETSTAAILNLASAIIELGDETVGTKVKTKSTWQDLFNNLAEFFRILKALSDATKDLGGRREGMGEGFVPGDRGSAYDWSEGGHGGR